MSLLEVVSAGIASSVQDAGRFGLQRYGLVPSGAMDRLSLATANSLAGNALFDAAIEIGPFGAAFTAREGPVRIALTGALRTAEIDGRIAPLYRTLLLPENATLLLGAVREGVFSYLAVEGGIGGEPSFGSRSVNARAGLGSPLPRSLQNGDRLPVATAMPAAVERMIAPPSPSGAAIRVVMGPQHEEFGAACELFLESEWRVSASSDRMGYRLEGPKLAHRGGYNIVSDGTVDGSIQVSGNGQPIVLMKDRGTTGGYPKIATIITADLGRFAQTRFGRSVRFDAISIENAQSAARAFQDMLHALPDRVRKIDDPLTHGSRRP